jgi:hypothetical protein
MSELAGNLDRTRPEIDMPYSDRLTRYIEFMDIESGFNDYPDIWVSDYDNDLFRKVRNGVAIGWRLTDDKWYIPRAQFAEAEDGWKLHPDIWKLWETFLPSGLARCCASPSQVAGFWLSVGLINFDAVPDQAVRLVDRLNLSGLEPEDPPISYLSDQDTELLAAFANGRSLLQNAQDKLADPSSITRFRRYLELTEFSGPKALDTKDVKIVYPPLTNPN